MMPAKQSPILRAWRAAQDTADGAYVGLGIGFPEMVARFQPPGRQPIFRTENGILGFGDAPAAGAEDWDLINAGKKAVTIKPGTAFFHHADSFAMVRGGHLDVAILGAYEVAETGDLANWSTGPTGVPAVGGAMDLVHGARQVAVITVHVTWNSTPKPPRRCTLPLMGIGCVTRVSLSLAGIDIVGGQFVPCEKRSSRSVDGLQSLTRADLLVQGSAAAAQANSRLAREIAAVILPQRKGPPVVVNTDEHSRATTADSLARLHPPSPAAR